MTSPEVKESLDILAQNQNRMLDILEKSDAKEPEPKKNVKQRTDPMKERIDKVSFAIYERRISALEEKLGIVPEIFEDEIPEDIKILISAVMGLPEDQRKALIEQGMKLLPKQLNSPSTDGEY